MEKDCAVLWLHTKEQSSEEGGGIHGYKKHQARKNGTGYIYREIHGKGRDRIPTAEHTG
jgi:hypothetical protein